MPGDLLEIIIESLQPKNEGLSFMNKIFARILDGIAIELMSPRFHQSDRFIEQNHLLLDNPPLPPRIRAGKPRLFMKQAATMDGFELYEFAFPSRVDTASQKNNSVFGRYYKLNDTVSKSTVVLLHGIFEKNYRQLERHALNFIKSGHNCLIVTLPYHMERAPKGQQSGNHFVSNDLEGIFTALRQSVSDVRTMVGWLNANGEKRVGIMGIDLGGLIGSIVASSTRRINYLILLAPAISPLQVTGYTRSGHAVDGRIEATGLTKQELYMLFEPWTLLHNRPVISKNRVLIIRGQHDAIVPSDSIDRVCEAWNQPRMIESRNGHLGIMASRKILKDVGAFLDYAFAPKKTTGASAE
jgi:pimeloyl-ACP methyl ester carboxylesterase